MIFVMVDRVTLLLQAVEVGGPRRWRWLLSDDATGVPLADHTVAVAAEDENATAFDDLYRHLRWNAEPDRRVESEAEIVEKIGAWAGEHILGAAIGAAI